MPLEDNAWDADLATHNQLKLSVDIAVLQINSVQNIT